VRSVFHGKRRGFKFPDTLLPAVPELTLEREKPGFVTLNPRIRIKLANQLEDMFAKWEMRLRT
jgi:hypothetical protein